jgi:competence protein ComEC
LSSLALVSTLASLVVGPVLPWLAAIFNHSSWFIMLSMVRISEWFAELPAAYFHVESPGVILLLLYCGLLVAFWCGWFQQRRFRAIALSAAVALAALWLAQRFVSGRQIELTVLPLNTSHAIYVDHGNRGEDWLIDCGNDTAARFATRPFLAAKGVNRLKNLALTHGDIQHVEGLDLLQSTFAIGTGWVGPTSFRSRAYREAATLLESAHRRRSAQRGDTIGPWTVLHPAVDDRFAQADDAALVVRGDFDGVRVLLLSDLGRIGQEHLLARTSNLRADIVVIGFPRGGEPLVDRLLTVISPGIVIIGETPEPMSEQRIRKVRERLENGGVTVMDTRVTGAVTISVSKGQYGVSSARKVSSLNRVAPIAGTSVK